MASTIQDYFGRLSALNRQRGMTGNMSVGKGTIDSALAEGYMDAAYKNRAASQTYELGKENAATAKFAAESAAKYQTGSLALKETELANTKAYQTAALANSANATNLAAYYNMASLQNQKDIYATNQALGLGTLGMQALGYGLTAYKNYKANPTTTTTTSGFDYSPETVSGSVPYYEPAINYNASAYQPVDYTPADTSTDVWGTVNNSFDFGSAWNSFLSFFG
jgi:hypothetical protein